MVTVNKSNFLEQSNDFIRRLPYASWISLDEEMTGILLPPEASSSDSNKKDPKPSKDDTPSMRYSSIKAVPERYSIIQLGICLFFQEDMDPESPQKLKKRKQSRTPEKRMRNNTANSSPVSTPPPTTTTTTTSNEIKSAPDAGFQKDKTQTKACANQKDDGTASKVEQSNTKEQPQKAKFYVRRYNFTLFPPPSTSSIPTREVVLNSSSIQFLQQHTSMNLDVWSRHGIPYCTGDIASKLLLNLYKEHFPSSPLAQPAATPSSSSSSSLPTNGSSDQSSTNSNYASWNMKSIRTSGITSSSSSSSTSSCSSSRQQRNGNHRHHLPYQRRRLELTRMEDKDFHARVMASLREWLDAAIIPREDDLEGASFLIPPCNSFLRRALYESIPNEYPNLILETTTPTTTTPANTTATDAPALATILNVGGGRVHFGDGDRRGTMGERRGRRPRRGGDGYSPPQQIPPLQPQQQPQQHQSSHPQIRVWRLNAQERKRRKERLWREGWEKLIQERIGMWRIVLALSKACRGELGFLEEHRDDVDLPSSLSPEERLAVSLDAPQAAAWTEASVRGPSLKRKQSAKRQRSQGGRRPIPLVVHNGLYDLLFLLTHFHSPSLPESWDECKRLIHSYFPIIYDTKTMASEYCIRETSSRINTHLGAVFERSILNQPRWNRSFYHAHVLRSANAAAAGAAGPRSSTRDRGGYGAGDESANSSSASEVDHMLGSQAHDASYDAYMTGAAFCGLSYIIQEQTQFPPMEDVSNKGEEKLHADIEHWNNDERSRSLGSLGRIELWNQDPNDEKIAWYYGRNKLHFAMSPYTIDLESSMGSSKSSCSDPLGKGMSLHSTFRVSGIDPSVTTGDVVRCLSGLTDSHDQRINFEILWVNDTTFVVAATIPHFRRHPYYPASLLKQERKDNMQAALAGHGKGDEMESNDNFLLLDELFRDQGLVLRHALTNRFSNHGEQIIPLADYHPQGARLATCSGNPADGNSIKPKAEKANLVTTPNGGTVSCEEDLTLNESVAGNNKMSWWNAWGWFKGQQHTTN